MREIFPRGPLPLYLLVTRQLICLQHPFPDQENIVVCSAFRQEAGKDPAQSPGMISVIVEG